MKKFEIDARELDCPKPLLRTRKALSEEQFDTLVILVGNVPARENVCRFLAHSGYSPQWEEKSGSFIITVQRNGKNTILPEKKAPSSTPGSNGVSGRTVLITDTRIGSEEEELGRLLMKGYLYTLTQLEELPASVIFMNSGIRLCLKDSENLDDLQLLEKNSVEILVCGTCLEFLNVREELAVGTISNMYEITSKLHGPEGVVSFT
jgi:selenium metabolism protein YedF